MEWNGIIFYNLKKPARKRIKKPNAHINNFKKNGASMMCYLTLFQDKFSSSWLLLTLPVISVLFVYPFFNEVEVILPCISKFQIFMRWVPQRYQRHYEVKYFPQWGGTGLF